MRSSLMQSRAHPQRSQRRSILPHGPVPLTFFGIHSLQFHDPALRPTIAFGTLRLWDTGVSWAEIEPTKGAWNFSRFDFAMQVAEQAGYEVIATLCRTPQWAAADPNASSFFGPGQSSPPADINDWATYVRTVATRYAGRIRFYEIWNEPGAAPDTGFWKGTVAQMVNLVRVAREEINSIDPSAAIISPPPAKFGGIGYFGDLLSAGVARYADIIGYHFYTDSVLPEDRVRLIQEVRNVLAAHGLNHMPLWDTESSLNVADSGGDSAYASRIAHMARWMILTWVNGVARTNWYTWAANPRGFVDPDTKVARADVITAYETVQGWMLGSVFHSCDRAGLWTCRLTLASGEDAFLYWTQDNSTRAVSVAPSVRVEELTGTVSTVSTGTINVTSSPVLVVSL